MTKGFAKAILLFLTSGIATLSPVQAQVSPDLFNVDSIRLNHPRILASEDDFQRIRDPNWDSLGMQYLSFLKQTGHELLDQPPIEYKLDGKRLLHQSRRFLKRVSTWALLYRVFGDTSYRDRVIRELENVSRFPDWNPQHYLDIGEMALGFAIGTDWLWEELSGEQRERFLDTLINKAIKPSLDEGDPYNWWVESSNNWNPVCHAGLVASALLIVESDPKLAERVIRRAIRSVPIAMDATDPDGIYPEGPIYWGYGTHFSAVLIDLLENATNSSFGLSEHQSFRQSIVFHSLAIAPSGQYYNFYDGGTLVRFQPVTAWFASRYDDPTGLYELKRSLKIYLESNTWNPEDIRGRNLAMLALWYPENTGSESTSTSSLPKNWKGNGPNPLAFVRESWDDPNSFYLAFKGGNGQISHAHMDAGSFVFEDEGIRWAIDLGAQDYLSLESKGLGIWDRRQHSDRWRIFRLGPYSHNQLLIDQRLQNAEGSASITQFLDTQNQVHGTVDLSDIYSGQADSYERTFTVQQYKVLSINDRIEGARQRTEQQGRQSATLRWRMLTEAAVEIENNEAILKQEGKTLFLKVVGPSKYVFRTESIDPPPNYWDTPNPGVRAIDFWCNTDDFGDREITVLMSVDKAALEQVANSL